MTVLLVLFTLIAFLIADRVVEHVREARLARAGAVDATVFPDGVSLAANHTWIREEGRGIFTIGLDEFIGRIVGAVEQISIPRTGAMVAPDLSGVVLKDGSRQLRVAVPVRGRIVEVNTKVLHSPALPGKDPYGAGWLMKIRTDRSGYAWPSLMTGTRAAEWLRTQTRLAKDFLSARVPQPVPATMYDGGEPAESALKRLDSDAWQEFQKAFITLQQNS